jgi:hypothetical protein
VVEIQEMQELVVRQEMVAVVVLQAAVAPAEILVEILVELLV